MVVSVESTASPQPSSSRDRGTSWYAVPAEIKQALARIATCWDRPELGDRDMLRLLADAPRYPEIWVSAYRYFFYSHNTILALEVITQLLEWIRQTESLPDDWDKLYPMLCERRDDPNIRLYINAYAASGLIQARLGNVEQAQQIAKHISPIEHGNEFGGTVIQTILLHSNEEDDDDDDEA